MLDFDILSRALTSAIRESPESDSTVQARELVRLYTGKKSADQNLVAALLHASRAQLDLEAIQGQSARQELTEYLHQLDVACRPARAPWA